MKSTLSVTSISEVLKVLRGGTSEGNELLVKLGGVTAVVTVFVVSILIMVELAENHEGDRYKPDAIDLKMEEESFWNLNQGDLSSSESSASESESEGEADTTVAVEKKATTSSSKAGSKDFAAEKMWREDVGKSVFVQKFFPPKGLVNGTKKYKMDLTMADVAKHNTRDDCWIVVESHVYDITKYIDNHPGGWLPVVNMAGKDVTDAFANYHPARVYKNLLPNFYIGDVTDSLDNEPFVIEHREIRQQLLRRGLFQTNNVYYYLKAIWLIATLGGALSCVLLSDSFAMHMLGAASLATFWQQLAFVGHDIGHNAVSHKKMKENTVGIIIGNIFGGISLGWWKRSHNVHHIVCNSIQNDPDIQHMPLFAVTDDIFDAKKLDEAGFLNKEKPELGFWSTYHDKFIAPDFLSRFLVSYQHFLFYPIMAVARFNLYVQGFIFVATAWKQDAWYAKKYQLLEFSTLCMFVGGLTSLVMSMPKDHRLPFLLLSHGMAGLLHVQICISHFTMKTYHGQAYNGLKDEWFTMQCDTTMNVACPRFFDFFHGGLQFQIEHHLYPRLPRHNLREARELVKAFCKKWDVNYHEPGFIAANVELVSGLYEVAQKCREGGLDKVGGFENTQIYDGLHAQG